MDVFADLRADLQGNNPVVDPPGGYDCLVVGAGPAGLAAGRYLGRYDRSVLVVDGGNQRASLIPTSHNYPGFAGMHGTDLLAAMREEAKAYGAIVEPGWVTSLKQLKPADDDSAPPVFEALVNARTVRARTVILATGVKNHKPVGVDDNVHYAGIASKRIRYCPICDAFEAKDKSIVSIGSSAHGVAEVLFIYRYSQNITIMPDVSPGLTDQERQLMAAMGVQVLDSPLVRTYLQDNMIVAVDASGGEHPFDIMYPSLGSHCYTELAEQLGCSLCPDGEILTDPHFATTVSGVWAAGDVVEGLDQVVVAEAQAAVTATAVHNSFRPSELKLLGELPVPNKNSANHPWSRNIPNGTVDIRQAALAADEKAVLNNAYEHKKEPRKDDDEFNESHTYGFKTKKGNQYHVDIEHWDGRSKKTGASVEFHPKGSDDVSINKSEGADSHRVFSTVSHILRHHLVQHQNVNEFEFQAREPNRARLYHHMLTRAVGKNGYTHHTNDYETHFVVKRHALEQKSLAAVPVLHPSPIKPGPTEAPQAASKPLKPGPTSAPRVLKPANVSSPAKPPAPAQPAVHPPQPATTHPSVLRPMTPHLPVPPKPLRGPTEAPHAAVPKPPKPAVI